MSPSDAPDRDRPVRPPFDTEAGLGFLFADVVRELPEFVPRYLELVEAGDDDPGAPVVLMELAEFVAARLSVIEIEGSALSRALGLVEALLDAHDDDVDAELVSYAFFDTFTVEDRRLLAARLGRRGPPPPRIPRAGVGRRSRSVTDAEAQRSTAPWACSAAAMVRARSSPTSRSVSVWSSAQKRRWNARLRARSATDGPR